MSGRVHPRVLNLQHRTLLEPIDRAFEAHASTFADHPCRAGCDHCCYGPFEVGRADLWNLAEGLAALDEALRTSILRRLRAAAAEQREWLPTGVAPTLEASGEDRFDAMCDALAATPCPMLVDGRCAVYAHRPEACRLRGATYASPAGDVAVDCPMGWTPTEPAIALDVIALDEAVARLEASVSVPTLGAGSTTIAIGLDALLGQR